MGDNSSFGLFLIFVLLLLLIAVKVGLTKAAPRRRPTTRSLAAVDDLTGDRSSD